MSTFDELLRDLQRDAQRVQPRDALQYCANWFQQRLEEQRNRVRDSAALSSVLPADHIRDISAWHSNGHSNSWNQPAKSQHPSGLESFTIASSTSASKLLSSDLPPEHVPSPFGTLNVPDNAILHPPTRRLASLSHPGRRSPFVPIPEEPPSGPMESHVSPRFNGAQISPGSYAPRSPHYSDLRQGDTHATYEPTGPVNPGDFLHPLHNTFTRRTSISAESIIPNSNPSNRPFPVHPKTAGQIARIKASISGNFIFRDLDPHNETDIINAMQEVKIGANDAIIRQGDDGEYFYVVEEGLLHCYIKEDGSPSPPSSAKPWPRGSSYHPEFGKKVAECRPGNSFGELALMYGHPRAATVLSMEPSTLWSLDRITFRTIILQAAHNKRSAYEQFLSTVSVLSSLSGEEKSKIADALTSRVCADGETIVEQGEMGDAFFIIEEGEAVVTKRVQGENGEWVEIQVGHLKRGDYFGELSLLRLAPRAATVRAITRTNPSESPNPNSDIPPQPKLNVAALGAPAFTRLLGPLAEIMERKAGEVYGAKAVKE